MCAAQDRADSSHHLFQREGLGDVIVAAHRQALDFVFDVVACGEEQDGKLGVALPEFAQDRESVHVGKHDVQNGEIEMGAGLMVEGFFAVGRGQNIESCETQGRGEQLSNRRLVVDHEDGCFGKLRVGHTAI